MNQDDDNYVNAAIAEAAWLKMCEDLSVKIRARLENVEHMNARFKPDEASVTFEIEVKNRATGPNPYRTTHTLRRTRYFSLDDLSRLLSDSSTGVGTFETFITKFAHDLGELYFLKNPKI